ncbi:hypothetical protein [Streptococcus cristatus]|uniref:Uncharacterized protein n=1 Tax=Streptococcus cristatus TaxID=45634 RepID=A0A512AEK4_STRCR|nr:hypothetical protein [Streptococcus cristatus]GEN98134.1 hypothetical protein SOL01_20080 [Streptococcus cristatus]
MTAFLPQSVQATTQVAVQVQQAQAMAQLVNQLQHLYQLASQLQSAQVKQFQQAQA